MSTLLDIHDVSAFRGSTRVFDGFTLRIEEGCSTAVIGPNGAGKTTLLLVASGRMFPTTGTVELLGEEVGAVDMAEVKPRIGWASSAMFADIPPRESVFDVVMTGAYAVSGRWREEYEDTDRDRAARLISAWGVADLSGRTYGTLSEGERKRTLIARALMSDPELLLLDEPGAGLTVDVVGFQGDAPATHEPLLQEIAERHGDLDVVVLAFAQLGGEQLTNDPVAAAALASVNFAGAISASIAASNVMRGRICSP